MRSSTVRVDYHHEPSAWWADSPDLAGFVATGRSLREVRQLVHEGIPFYLEGADVEIVEAMPSDGLVVDVVYTGLFVAPAAESQRGIVTTSPTGRVPAWA